MTATITSAADFNAFAGNVFATGVRTLGIVTWFSIREMRVAEADLHALAAKHGIQDPPKLGCAADAFRRATTAQQQTGEATDTRYLMRPVTDNAEKIVRHLVREDVDRRGVKLAHQAVGAVWFTKAGETVGYKVADSIVAAGGAAAAEVDRILAAAVAEYDSLRKSFAGQDLRGYIMRQLRALCTVSVNPHGSVHFVPARFRSNVQAFAGLVRDLSAYCTESGAKNVFAVVPVPDVPEQRELVADGFRATVTTELDGLMADLATMLAKGDKLRPATVEGKLAEIAEARRKAGGYARLLGIEVGEIQARCEILTAQATELLARTEQARAAKKTR